MSCSSEVRFFEWPEVLDAEQCRRVVDASAPHLARSTTAGAQVHPARTSSERTLSRAELAALLPDGAARLELALRAATNAPPEHREPWRVIRYKPGQQYGPHCDWYPPGAYPRQVAMGGQRATSVVVYLCDVALGGETDFPALGKRFRPELGKLLAWNNVGPGGQLLQCTLHAGLPPVGCDKWIMSSWYRERPYSGPGA